MTTPVSSKRLGCLSVMDPVIDDFVLSPCHAGTASIPLLPPRMHKRVGLPLLSEARRAGAFAEIFLDLDPEGTFE